MSGKHPQLKGKKRRRGRRSKEHAERERRTARILWCQRESFLEAGSSNSAQCNGKFKAIEDVGEAIGMAMKGSMLALQRVGFIRCWRPKSGYR